MTQIALDVFNRQHKDMKLRGSGLVTRATSSALPDGTLNEILNHSVR